MQKSRFTASKPSIFAIASDEKFIRHLVTSFHQRSLSQSAYQNDPTKPNFGTLTATTYGNGAKVRSRYDDFNRVTGVVYGEETAPRYEYDYNAKGQVARVRDNLLNRMTQSEYDLANRPVRVKTAEAGQHVYTGQVAYDNVYGNLSEFTEKVGENRQEFGTKFGYDDENRPTSLTYSASGKEIGQSTTSIDKLNRTTFSAVKLGSKTFTSEYHFAAGGYGTGSVTNLVASITQPGCNCGYGYDDNGNIASATLNGKWTGYTYDALGQLIQVNDHSDTRSGADGTTWKYTYDLGGNILKKERFVYNDTTNPLETVTYEYGDANWRDKLTAVNGSTIRYDAIGNPLNDGTWTYTWQNGRQLQKMQKAGVTAEFVYNADGLRVQKTVNGVATKYTLHGKNVVHMISGADELHIFYDAQNRPAVVVYNGTAYAYVKSLQGDIVAILDENGNMVVSYGYDAWGAPLWCTGELAETLGKVQPFRYRGYVFDEETGLYYLRSRYYNPRWGRFVNADCLIGAKNNIIQNCFAYCENAPTLQKDADGMRSENEKKNEPRVGVYSVGVASNVTFIYECSYVQGYCWDDYGNVGLFRTYVGIPSEEELTVLKEDPEAYFAAGMSGVGVSVAYVTSGVQARDIFALAGKGCYIGGGADILISAGVDAVFLDANVNEIVDNRPCDGYQTSIGVGLGLAPLHMGNSFTIIKPLKWKGVRLSDEESKWMTGRPDN